MRSMMILPRVAFQYRELLHRLCWCRWDSQPVGPSRRSGDKTGGPWGVSGMDQGQDETSITVLGWQFGGSRDGARMPGDARIETPGYIYISRCRRWYRLFALLLTVELQAKYRWQNFPICSSPAGWPVASIKCRNIHTLTMRPRSVPEDNIRGVRDEATERSLPYTFHVTRQPTSHDSPLISFSSPHASWCPSSLRTPSDDNCGRRNDISNA